MTKRLMWLFMLLAIGVLLCSGCSIKLVSDKPIILNIVTDRGSNPFLEAMMVEPLNLRMFDLTKQQELLSYLSIGYTYNTRYEFVEYLKTMTPFESEKQLLNEWMKRVEKRYERMVKEK